MTEHLNGSRPQANGWRRRPFNNVHQRHVAAVATALFLSIIGLPAWAQAPPAGTDVYYELLSPVFLGGADVSTSTESPIAEILNPAVSGLKQRSTVDLSYLGLLGPADDPGYGNIINAGLAVPSAVGVFSGNAHLLISPFAGVDLGTLVSFNLNFAKDVYPDFLVGLGVDLHFGSNDAFDWGLSANMGFLHLPGDLGFLKDFTWGVAVRELGKGFSPVSGSGAYPAPFTPHVAAAFNLISTEIVKWGFAADISLPFFQGLRCALGTELSVAETFFLRASFPVYLESWSTFRLRFPSFGFGLRFRTDVRQTEGFLAERGWTRSDVNLNFAAAPLRDGHWVFGAGVNIPLGVVDNQPPAITWGDSITYLSPNFDGVQDTLVVPLKVTESRYIEGYRFTINDASGKKIRETLNKDRRLEEQGGFFDRLAYVKKSISIPGDMRWDGRNDGGRPAPDGEYTYLFECWDDSGNIGRTDPRQVILDSTAPSVELAWIAPGDRMFSPDQDGEKDTLLIEQNGSREDTWVGTVHDVDGQAIKRFVWRRQAPPDFVWDGRDNEGDLVRDGVFTYHVAARDRAGNSASARIDNIVVNTRSIPIEIDVVPAAFSPNGDGVKDSVSIGIDIPVREGLEQWVLRVVDEQGRSRRTYSAVGDLPPSLSFDGRGERGSLLPDGGYAVELTLTYAAGQKPSARSSFFTLDTTAPRARAGASPAVFSPNGDGNKDWVTIEQRTSTELVWQGTITSSPGEVVASFSWQGTAADQFDWKGLSSDGALAPDGRYTYRVFSTDNAGNYGTSTPVEFELDTEETPVILTVDPEHFSPNGDGVRDRVRLAPKIAVAEGISNYQVSVISEEDGQPKKQIEGTVWPKDAFLWDGLQDDGSAAVDGAYRAEITVEYAKGDRSTARSNTFWLDTVFPEAEVTASAMLFSPDGDGSLDEILIDQATGGAGLWVGTLFDSRGNAVRTYYWPDRASGFRWNGTDELGNAVPDGSYSYALRAEDEAGNTTQINLLDIRVDTSPTPLFVTTSTEGFSPNGDGFRDTVEFGLFAPAPQGMREWALEMVDQDSVVQKRWTGETADSLPTQLVWDGLNDNEAVAEGRYRAVLSAVYTKGNQPVVEGQLFLLDVSPPGVDIAIQPIPFSPDNDGVDDDLSITIAADDASLIESWSAVISDPKGRAFTSYSGEGKPSSAIIWEGRSDQGELAAGATEYALTLRIRDVLGNSTEMRRAIPVGLLVLRKEDTLSITLAVLPPVDTTSGIEQSLSSIGLGDDLLRHLAGLLNRYGSYVIRIEGHADDSPAPPQEGKTPSLRLAEAVKSALARLGVDPARMTAEGLGNSKPLYPIDDHKNKWQNTKIEIVLSR